MKILVIGASARAAAQSVQRAGNEVAALDLFGDRDLCEIANCESIRQYPDSIVEQAKRWPDHSIILCGGMENHPEIFSELEKRHSVIGPNASQIRELRNLKNWQDWVANFASADWLRFPTTRTVASIEDLSPIANNGSDAWLWKSRHGAGGMQVFRSSDYQSNAISAGYLQRYIPGPVLGVTFRCAPYETSILGVMRNVTVGESNVDETESSKATPFLYAGSTGPFSIGSDIELRLARWVGRIAKSINYQGVLQADFVFGNDGYLYLLEFNPRWTASMELIEMCFGKNLFAEQLRNQFPQRSTATTHWDSVALRDVQVQKRILYATQDLTISTACSDAMMERSNGWVARQNHTECLAGWADIPHAGTRIACGAPIATIWAFRAVSPGVLDSHFILKNPSPFPRWPEIENLRKTLLTS